MVHVQLPAHKLEDGAVAIRVPDREVEAGGRAVGEDRGDDLEFLLLELRHGLLLASLYGIFMVN